MILDRVLGEERSSVPFSGLSQADEKHRNGLRLGDVDAVLRTESLVSCPVSAVAAFG